MAVEPSELEDAIGKRVRVKLFEQALAIEGELQGGDKMKKEGYAPGVFGIQVGRTLRPFEAVHVEGFEEL